MEGTTVKEKQLPLWRAALGFLLALAAAAFLLNGSVSATAKDTLSKRMINRVISDSNLWEGFEEDAVKAINIGIAHLTNTPYQENSYITKAELAQVLDKAQIKSVLVNKIYEFSSAVTSDRTASLEASEIVPLIEPVKTYVEQKYGIELPEDRVLSEIENAIDASRYDSPEGIHILHPARAVVCIVVGIILMMGVYGITWPKVNYAGVLCLAVCILLCIALAVSGKVILRASSIAEIDELQRLFGSDLLSLWLNKSSAMFIRRAFLSLLGCLVPIILSIIYTIDRKHVRRIWKTSKHGE